MLTSRHSRSLFSLPSPARVQCFRCAEGTIRSRSCRIRGDTSFAIRRAVTSTTIRLQGTRSARGWLNDVIELKVTRGIDLFWMVFGEVKVSEEANLITAPLAASYISAAEGGEFQQPYELILDALGWLV